ncbi:MAG TPA: hypothetical protein VMA98_09245 [Candidatus Acidoferrales bacterium]|nr:hypothetical protein [Candidatus Acidoferrales bacterium]
MRWEELLAAFRSLGGIADNVRLGDGPFGRGIFPIDANAPARLWAPDALHVRVADIELQGRHMSVKDAGYDPRVRSLFEAYEAHFGWGAGGYEESYAKQAAWHALPAGVVAAIRETGALARPAQRFLPPDDALALSEYLASRRFLRDGEFYIVPLIDLVNHSGGVPGYVVGGGYGVAGTFRDEVLVCYSPNDAWSIALNYGFAAPATIAYSVGATITLPGSMRLSIAREILEQTVEHNLRVPTVSTSGDQILLSHLVLGIESAKDLPRAIFRTLTGRAGVSQSDYVFDAIAQYNRLQFIALLRLLRRYDGALARTLEDAVINQLEALCACIGAKTL